MADKAAPPKAQPGPKPAKGQQSDKGQGGQGGNDSKKGSKGKGPAQDPPPPRTIQNSEVMKTLNQLLESASVLTMQAFVAGQRQSSGEGETSKDGTGAAQLGQLARKRVGDMKALAKKAVVALDPSVKRMICKRCDTLLFPASLCMSG